MASRVVLQAQRPPIRRASRALGVTALLALLAASLLFLLPGGPLHAQEAAIQYAENGTGPVATYTAVDPEGTAVKWGLSGVDAGEFSIDGGVLAFKKSPDFEKATGGRSDDTDVRIRVERVEHVLGDRRSHRQHQEEGDGGRDRHRHQRGRAGDGEADDVEAEWPGSR